MWLFHPLGFASIVADENNLPNLMVRGRFKGDLQRLFPLSRRRVKTTPPPADYRYRVSLPRDYVSARLAELTATIDYPNFKDAAPADRHDTYMRVWSAMYGAQERRRRKLDSDEPYDWWHREGSRASSS